MTSLLKKTVTLAAILFPAAILTTPAVAVQVAHYDLATAAAPSLAATSTLAPFTASALVAVGVSGSPFSNHFYHSGWNTTLNVGKYYENTIGAGGSAFTLSGVTFSLENTGGVSNYFLRSSLDGFASDFASGSFVNGDVTNFSVNLSSLGVISSSVTFRWYMTAASTGTVAGFANHEPGGAGGGLPDVGQDLRFHGELASSVPDGGSTIALLGLAMSGLALARRKLGVA